MPGATRERSGTYTHQVTIEQATEAQNSVGEVILTFPGTTVATVWASKEEYAGGEGVAAAQTHATRHVRWRMHYRADILAKMRLHEGAQVYDILTVNDRDGRKRELELLTVERGV